MSSTAYTQDPPSSIPLVAAAAGITIPPRPNGDLPLGQPLPHRLQWGGCAPAPRRPPHLSVQASSHCHNVARLTVDGEHVLGGALGGLGHDPVAHHPVGCGGVIRVVGCDCHHVGACNRDGSSCGTRLPRPRHCPSHTPQQMSPAVISSWRLDVVCVILHPWAGLLPGPRECVCPSLHPHIPLQNHGGGAFFPSSSLL